MTEFEAWNETTELPHIEIYTIALEGTYDAFRREVVHERSKVLCSQLFSEILPLEQLSQLNPEGQAAIGEINIDFRPA